MISYFNPAKIISVEEQEMQHIYDILQGKKVSVPFCKTGYYFLPFRRLIDFNLSFGDVYIHNMWWNILNNVETVISHMKYILGDPTEEYFIELMKCKSKSDLSLVAAIDLICCRYTVGSTFFGGPFYKKELAFTEEYFSRLKSFSAGKIKISDNTDDCEIVFHELGDNFLDFSDYEDLIRSTETGLFVATSDKFLKKTNYEFNKVGNIYCLLKEKNTCGG